MNDIKEYPYGGFFRRGLALILDAMIMIIPCAIAAHVIPFVGAFAVVVLYYPVFDSSSAQATPGRFIMGLRVTAEDGSRLGFGRALVRHLMAYVSGLLFGLGYFIQLFTEKRQTLHDMVAGALVLREARTTSPHWGNVWLEQMRAIMSFEDKATAHKTARFDNSHKTEAPTSPASVTDEGLNQIQKLQELLKSGALTEEEFQAQKSQILDRMLKA